MDQGHLLACEIEEVGRAGSGPAGASSSGAASPAPVLSWLHPQASPHPGAAPLSKSSPLSSRTLSQGFLQKIPGPTLTRPLRVTWSLLNKLLSPGEGHGHHSGRSGRQGPLLEEDGTATGKGGRRLPKTHSSARGQVGRLAVRGCSPSAD